MKTKSEQLQIRLTAHDKATLKRRARQAGQDVSTYVLSRVLPPEAARFERLVRALAEAGERRFTLAELNDLLASLAPGTFADAVGHAEVGDLPPLERNYVAAMVEQAAHEKGVQPPAWVRGVVPLDDPWFAAPLKGLRAHLLRSAPVPFKRRNLFVDATVGDRV